MDYDHKQNNDNTNSNYVSRTRGIERNKPGIKHN